jgi:hypothetical protein
VGAGLAGLTIVVWLFGGGWLAAALEAEGARLAAAEMEEDMPGGRAGVSVPGGGSVAGRILAARLVAVIPLVLVIAWASFRLVLTTYIELTSPHDVTTPIVLRVLAATPEVIVAVVAAWMAGEIVGAIAARRITLAGDGVARALLAAVGECVRHPLSFWIPTLVLGVVVVPTAVASAAAWSATGDALADGGDPLRVLVSVVALVVLFTAGLVLLGVVCAWRAAIWTIAETVRQRTFGGSTDSRSGDWRTEGSSATL